MIDRDTYEAYVRHLLAGERAACAQIVSDLMRGQVGLKGLYTELFQRALYEIGGLWEQNRICVATEHLATAITESLMNSVRTALLGAARSGKRAVIACSANEFHQVGAKMVADVLELRGWDTYFLGANTPAEALVGFIGARKPDITGLSLSLKTNLPVLSGVLDRLRAEYPGLGILIGGQAFRDGAGEWQARWPGVTYVASLQELETLITRP